MLKHFPIPFFLLILASFSVHAQQTTIDEMNHLWKTSINENNSLNELYESIAVKANEEGVTVNGISDITSIWSADEIEINSIYSTFQITADSRNRYIYSIGGFNNSEGESFKHLLIWTTKDDAPKRELEFVAPSTLDIEMDPILDERRTEWMEYCNGKDVEGLVSNLYADNAIYYNHRPVLIGREALIREYQYMSNPNYSLTLSPLHVEMVTESLAYEIGQCEGSYNGKYMLIWQKNEAGEWRILLDSNI